MSSPEFTFTFSCGNEQLIGILNRGFEEETRGLLVVVGGPQYRVGSHRQFVLLARQLSVLGVPVLRFDYRGMGDSEGDAVTFTDINRDIATAINIFFQHCTSLKEVVIWGLCDAASAALLYAWRDPRVKGLVLLNPWVRTDTGIARTYLKNYYLARLSNRDLWRKLVKGQFDVLGSLGSFFGLLKQAINKKRFDSENHDVEQVDDSSGTLPSRMALGFDRFHGPVLIILSGDDLTAAEYKEIANTSEQWRPLLRRSNVKTLELHGANHTFSQGKWRNQVVEWTYSWMRSW